MQIVLGLMQALQDNSLQWQHQNTHFLYCTRLHDLLCIQHSVSGKQCFTSLPTVLQLDWTSFANSDQATFDPTEFVAKEDLN